MRLFALNWEVRQQPGDPTWWGAARIDLLQLTDGSILRCVNGEAQQYVGNWFDYSPQWNEGYYQKWLTFEDQIGSTRLNRPTGASKFHWFNCAEITVQLAHRR